ncbi:MAG: hypothetical protein MJZ57_06490 [Bacteroidales bacterium]|nr:hypothetical protein [Bacteroidales bacterium]
MSNKIIKIIIFAVAILDCILALVFSFGFNEDKKDNYVQVQQIEAKAPQMLSDFQAATPESLPKVVKTYQDNLAKVNDSLKDVQLQKDILYTYLLDLKNLKEDNFKQYKADFATRAEGLFAKCDKKKEYVDGFNGVNDYKALESYVTKVEEEYSALKQSYLTDRNYLKAANSLVSRADQINMTASANKKAADLTDMQNDIKGFLSSAKLQNAFILIGYFLGLVTIAALLFFALTKIVKNFKSSYKILIVLALFALIVFIGYIVGSSELSTSAQKAGMTVNSFKMVNAACFTFYVFLIVSVLSIIVTAVLNAIKNRK